MGTLAARVRAFTADRRKVAIAGVAGLGAVALLALARKRSGGGGGGGGTDGVEVSDGPGYYPPGTFPNTTGTDIAAAIGDLDSRYADQLAEFTDQLQDTQDAIGKLTPARPPGKDPKIEAPNKRDEKDKRGPRDGARSGPGVPIGKGAVFGPLKPKDSGPAGKTYVVKRGDTLGAIARRYNTTVGRIANKNDINNPNRINVGQKLRIPG